MQPPTRSGDVERNVLRKDGLQKRAVSPKFVENFLFGLEGGAPRGARLPWALVRFRGSGHRARGTSARLVVLIQKQHKRVPISELQVPLQPAE
jgi:hypothetical protein